MVVYQRQTILGLDGRELNKLPDWRFICQSRRVNKWSEISITMWSTNHRNIRADIACAAFLKSYLRLLIFNFNDWMLHYTPNIQLTNKSILNCLITRYKCFFLTILINIIIKITFCLIRSRKLGVILLINLWLWCNVINSTLSSPKHLYFSVEKMFVCFKRLNVRKGILLPNFCLAKGLLNSFLLKWICKLIIYGWIFFGYGFFWSSNNSGRNKFVFHLELIVHQIFYIRLFL